MKIAGLTDTGLKRSHNEDAIAFDPAQGWLVVADGVGGHAGGETAATLAVAVFKEAYTYRGGWEGRDLAEEEEFLELLVGKANRAIHKQASIPKYAAMGTTIVALGACRKGVALVHVGDSRAYLFRRGKLKRLTRDHSYADSKRRFGFFSRNEEEHRRDPLRNVVLRALGPEATVKCDVNRHGWKRGDVFLLCTDGLSDYVSSKDMSWTLSDKGDDLEGAAKTLIDLANRNGGHDNITVGLAAF